MTQNDHLIEAERNLSSADTYSSPDLDAIFYYLSSIAHALIAYVEDQRAARSDIEMLATALGIEVSDDPE